MQGHVNVSTFDYMATDPKTTSILKDVRAVNGTPVVCDKVWISSIGCAGDLTREQTGEVKCIDSPGILAENAKHLPAIQFATTIGTPGPIGTSGSRRARP